MRYAIVTPYYKESRQLLERCIDSVRAQTIAADHILVADGHPQDWIDGAGVRHIRLDRAHGDYGNTPRGIGAVLAIAEQYDGLGLLDADNWLDARHVEHCLATHDAAKLTGAAADYVIARRNFCRPDGSVMPVVDEPVEHHVDTNCFFFFPGAYHIVPYFGTMPRELSPVCDRIFFLSVRHRGLRGVETGQVTVNYHCLWEAVYHNIGELPPPGSKPNIDGPSVQAWIDSRTPEERFLAQRLSGWIP